MKINMNCLDTYALIEIYNGNPKFAKILFESFVIPDITMTEFYFVLLKDKGKDVAEHWLKKMQFYCYPVELETMIKAVEFKLENKKENLSFFDCFGYIYAIEKNYFFVTGDKKFRNRKNVRFIKK